VKKKGSIQVQGQPTDEVRR